MYRLFMVAAVCVLFMPFFGPLLDHHFAERQRSHGHIFLGSAGLEHSHFYEVAHTHSHSHAIPATPGNSGPESNELPDEVIYLTSQDGVGPGFVSFVTISAHLDLGFPDFGNPYFLLSPGVQNSLPPGTLISPPKKPPRV